MSTSNVGLTQALILLHLLLLLLLLLLLRLTKHQTSLPPNLRKKRSVQSSESDHSIRATMERWICATRAQKLEVLENYEG
jgi:hypothetical protein